jgi:hypothetical protein
VARGRDGERARRELPSPPAPLPRGRGVPALPRLSLGASNLSPDALEYLRRPVEDEAVLETQDSESCRREPTVTDQVMAWCRKVRDAIGFDDEARILGEEVDDEGAEWVLPAKLYAVEPASTELSPESLLCRSLGSAQRARAIGELPKQTRHSGHVGFTRRELRVLTGTPLPSGRGAGGEGKVVGAFVLRSRTNSAFAGRA